MFIVLERDNILLPALRKLWENRDDFEFREKHIQFP